MAYQRNEQRLYDAIMNGRIPHAVLIAGPQGSDAGLIARRAAACYCLHTLNTDGLKNCPDYFELGPESILVDDVRALQSALGARPFGECRAVVLLEAHRMNAFAQNALLKTLEEPRENILMLLAGQQEGLLPTIRSRCLLLRLGAQQVERALKSLIGEGAEEQAARLAAFLSEGAVGLARDIASQAHMAMFAQAAELLFTAAHGPVPPYAAMAQLLDTQLVHDKEARSKAQKQRPTARYILLCWRALCRDMLHVSLGLAPDAGNPLLKRTAQAAQRFTTGEIQGMIDIILSAQRRVEIANPSLSMDALLTEMLEGKHTWVNE